MALKYRKPKPGQDDRTYRAPHWEEDEYVLLKRFKTGFVTLQAQHLAQSTPDWLTPEVAREMSPEEYSKATWDNAEFNVAVIREMMDGPWKLRDADGEEIDYDLDLIREIFDDRDVACILAEIRRRGMGPRTDAPAPKGDFESQASF